MPKNYYIILGIPADSSQDDIKAAYRRLAKEYHPDHYGSNKGPFQMIHEAYAVLSDPGQRRSYDKDLHKRITIRKRRDIQPVRKAPTDYAEPMVPGGGGAVSGATSLDRSIHHYNNLFDGLFDRMLSTFSEHYFSQQPQSHTITVELTPDQAEKGGNIRLSVPMEIRCPNCNSLGRQGFYSCWRCSGEGILTGEKQVLISYPPGVSNGHTIELPVTRVGNQEVKLTAIFTLSKER